MDRREYLFVQSTTEQGGAETVLLNALRASPELRERSALVTLGFGSGDLPERARAMGVAVVELEPARLRHPLGALRLARRIATEARRRRVRVIIGNGAHPQVFAGVAARLAGSKAVYFIHEIHEPRLLSNHLINIVALRGPCDFAIANSLATISPVRQLRPSLPGTVVYPGTQVRGISADNRDGVRTRLGIPSDSCLFGLFGRLQYGKGQDVFLDAAARVARAHPECRFAVVGGTVFGLESEYPRLLTSRASELGIADRVIFTDHVSDVGSLMAACDVICHASRSPESFGMVLVEAMARGRAVVATRSGGPAEIVLDGETGILVPPGDADALAIAMVRLVDSPDLRESLASRSVRRAREMFSVEEFASRLHAVLASVA